MSAPYSYKRASAANLAQRNTHTAAESIIWRGLRAMAIERQGNKCFYCTRPMAPPGTQSTMRATLEHLVQRSEGGENSPENTVAACFECNYSRPMSETALAASDRSLARSPTLRRAARVLAEQRWQEEIEARRDEYERRENGAGANETDADPGAQRETVAFWLGRGAELDECGETYRIRDALKFLSACKMIDAEQHTAGRRFQRLYLEAHEILQPWQPPQEMMEWRLDRVFALSEIYRVAFQGRRDVIEACVGVCARNEWIAGRYARQAARLESLRFGLTALAEHIDLAILDYEDDAA